MSLSELRVKIDEIDARIIELLNNRAEVALEISQIKRQEELPIYQPDRERAVLERIKQLSGGYLSEDSIVSIYREIISGTRCLQGKRVRVAYLGPEATFSHLAVRKEFGNGVDAVPKESIPEVARAVEREEADYGVVPIENSIEGSVAYTLDMLIDSRLNICAELLLAISLNLVANCELKEIKTLYSHPQPLAQSRTWLRDNLPGIEYIETSSTSAAAKLAKEKSESGAIASALAAELYGLEILARHIEDKAGNYTRFLVLGNQTNPVTGDDKTSILFSITDKPGALYHITRPFAELDINLTKIESRPSRRQLWEYVFFLDFQGHVAEDKVKKALDQLKEECLFLKVLGSYPRETMPEVG
ncbi:MAG: prephenate dehydratase [bacterium]|nr:prephenate dehydratase [bacterium]